MSVRIPVTDPDTYSSAEVCRRAGISYRQLDYWTRLGYLQPLTAALPGSGHDRRFDEQQAAQAVMMGRLVTLGVSAQKAALVASNPLERAAWIYRLLTAVKT